MPKKKRPKTQKLGSVCTQEPIDANGLRAVACRKAAAHVCWPGSNVDVRTVLLSTMARAQGDHADSRQLAVEWQESAADYGFPHAPLVGPEPVRPAAPPEGGGPLRPAQRR